MGFFSGVTSSIQRVGRQVGRGAQRIGRQTSQNLVGAQAAPFEIVGRGIAKSVKGAAPALGAITNVARQNPELTRLAGGLTGLPLGDAFGGGSPAPQFIPSAPIEPPQNNTMLLVLGAAAILVLVLVMRK